MGIIRGGEVISLAAMAGQAADKDGSLVSHSPSEVPRADDARPARAHGSLNPLRASDTGSEMLRPRSSRSRPCSHRRPGIPNPREDPRTKSQRQLHFPGHLFRDHRCTRTRCISTSACAPPFPQNASYRKALRFSTRAAFLPLPLARRADARNHFPFDSWYLFSYDLL